ncbi:unnamed protein product [Euphydryas editha]|uniref:Uncharacterized protein n=1 Tax=Euphydryas editha TaxID=104508 RepID=A0AAU9TE88_EUPED|nr:unnamed protein product [Euphydryas editha]
MVISSEKRSCLSSVVQWCFCAFALVLCGYSLVRLQRLEQRLKALEDLHLRVEDTSFSFHQTKELVLKRETRDVADCVCPSAIRPNGSIRSIENVLSDRDQAYKSAFIQFNTSEAGCRAV